MESRGLAPRDHRRSHGGGPRPRPGYVLHSTQALPYRTRVIPEPRRQRLMGPSSAGSWGDLKVQ